MPSEPLQRILDETEVRNLYYRYARGVDRLDAELLSSCFHEDAQVTTSSTQIRDNFVRSIMQGLSRFKMTQHITANVWVEVGRQSRERRGIRTCQPLRPGREGRA